MQRIALNPVCDRSFNAVVFVSDQVDRLAVLLRPGRKLPNLSGRRRPRTEVLPEHNRRRRLVVGVLIWRGSSDSERRVRVGIVTVIVVAGIAITESQSDSESSEANPGSATPEAVAIISAIISAGVIESEAGMSRAEAPAPKSTMADSDSPIESATSIESAATTESATASADASTASTDASAALRKNSGRDQDQ